MLHFLARFDLRAFWHFWYQKNTTENERMSPTKGLFQQEIHLPIMDFQENLVSFPVRNLRIRHFFSQQNLCGTGCSSRLEASKIQHPTMGFFGLLLELRKPEQCHHPCRRVLKVLWKWSFFWKYKWIQQGDISCIYPNHVSVHPRSLTAWPWKMMVGSHA